MLPGRRRQIVNYIRKRFGKNPLEFPDAKRCRERLEQVRILHDTFYAAGDSNPYAVDDVTWADLEMDEVFLRINQTGSYIGEQVLYQILRSGNEPFYRENSQMMQKLEESEDARQELSLRLYPIGKKQANYYLPRFFENAGLLRPGHSWIFHVLQACLALAVLLAVFFRTVPFYAALGLSVAVNFIVYMVMKMKYDILLSSFSGIGQALELYEWSMQQKKIPLPVSSGMKEYAGRLKKIRKKIGFLVYTKQASVTGDVMGLLFDYLMGVTLIDVGRIDGILRLIDENREAVLEAFTFVGRLDAALSILSFRKSLTHWTVPVFAEGGAPAAQNLYHPLIRDPVSNDFSLQDRAVLTGANASGKSTFMKSLAASVILAQTIDTACAGSLSLPFMKVMTSMAIRDDVVSGESYYVREVRYLKRMLDEIERGTLTLCVIDEILKGTNQAERLAASEAVLKYLTHFPGYCIIATHDMELVEKLQELYKPYYFESHISENNVTFDYKIHPGRGGESNALALLRAFGFPDEIIRDASASVQQKQVGNNV